MKAIFGFLILFIILVSFSALQQEAFAKTVTIDAVPGSGAPGCEERGGCYSPMIVSINTGDVVRMTNTDSAAHTYTSGDGDAGPDGFFDTSLLMSGGSFEWSPKRSGEYPYFCMVHPWMTGMILVGSGSSYTPPTPTPYTPPTSSGTDWQAKYLEVLSDFNDVSAKVGELQRENQDLRNKVSELETTVANLNTIIMEQVKVIYDWVLGK
ncbi:hypothetical protein [Nitrosopumilus sp.]|uniref:hypothetical protein n=1 Tax=Nitrosopumilus sp. TaxID=2024843 RepID=UPI003D0E4167